LYIAGSTLCVGSEWHRFPSSFFVPEYISEVRWIDDGFRGLLPLPFNSTLGGTAAAPPYFNNKNKASDEQFVIEPTPRFAFFSSSLPFCYKVNNTSFAYRSEILKLVLS
jgi:alpha-1,2-mannosyltransferase